MCEMVSWKLSDVTDHQHLALNNCSHSQIMNRKPEEPHWISQKTTNNWSRATPWFQTGPSSVTGSVGVCSGRITASVRLASAFTTTLASAFFGPNSANNSRLLLLLYVFILQEDCAEKRRRITTISFIVLISKTTSSFLSRSALSLTIAILTILLHHFLCTVCLLSLLVHGQVTIFILIISIFALEFKSVFEKLFQKVYSKAIVEFHKISILFCHFSLTISSNLCSF